MTHDLLKRKINRPVHGLRLEGERGVLEVDQKVRVCRRQLPGIEESGRRQDRGNSGAKRFIASCSLIELWSHRRGTLRP